MILKEKLTIKQIAIYNLLALVVFHIILRMVFSSESGDQYAGMGQGIIGICAIIAVMAINLICSVVFFIRKEKPIGIAFLLNVLISALIGGSVCFAFVATY